MTRRFVLICPKGVRTGGPKDLHQLLQAIRDVYNSEAVLCDIDGSLSGRESNQPHIEYTKFQPIWIEASSITELDILVLPETHLKYARNFPENLIVIWWLSLYNGLSSYNKRVIRRLDNFPKSSTTYPIILNLITVGHRIKLRYLKLILSRKLIHVSQSVYAHQELNRAGIKSIYLRDYLDDYWLTPRKAFNSADSNLVLSNGAKNKQIIGKLARDPRFANFKFELLSGLDQSELEAKFRQSVAYVDFGYHPGKDHLPREAAAIGIPLVLNTRGAASNSLDYRFNVVSRISNPLSRRGRRELLNCLTYLQANNSLKFPLAELLASEYDVFINDLNKLMKLIQDRLSERTFH